MAEGWISLHRKFLEWEWYDDINTKLLFIHLLLKANHKEKNWKGITIPKGSFLTGRKQLAIETKLTEQQIRTSLKKLKSTNEIAIKTTNLYSLVSINNWDRYQENNQQKTKRVTKKQPTGNQQVTTTNNDNNDNNENNNIYRQFSHLKITNEENQNLIELGYSQTQIDSIYDNIQNYKKNTQYSSLYLTAKNWLKKEYSDKNHRSVNQKELPSHLKGMVF